ncbi:MAG: polysaccharide biosynthesis tyrosine autokinase [bacterium]
MVDDNHTAADQVARTAPADEPTGLQDYLERLDRRKWLALGVFLAVLVLAALSIVRTEPVYEAVATMMLSSTDESSIFGRSGMVFWPREPNVAKCIELLRSRSLAERVALRLPDTVRVGPNTLRGMITARPVRDAGIIQLAASAPTPEAAVLVVNTYLETYQQYDLEQSRTDVSSIREFIEDQLGTAAVRLDSVERNLAQFKSSRRLASLDAETQALVDRLAGLAALVEQADIDARTSEARLAVVRQRIEQEGEGMADRLGGISSPMVASLRQALNQREVEKANLLMRGFDESSERVRGLERQIDSARARLRTESQVLISQQGFVDPVGRLSGLFESALDIEIDLVASRARRAALAKVLAEYEASVARLPEAERALAGLTRDVETGRRVHSLLSERREEARIQEVGRISSVRIIDRALGASRTKPNVPSSAAFGLVIALALALGAAWVVDRFDTAVRSPRDLERRGHSVLASIPQYPRGDGRARGRRKGEQMTAHLITHVDSEASAAEAFRMLRTSLSFAGIGQRQKVIAVTSPGPSEGKSTIVVNLGAVLAQAGSRVLLVDADMRHPVLHTAFGKPKKPGFTDLVLSGESTAASVFPTPVDKLFCLPCGTIPPSPADLLTAPATRELIARLAGEYDYVLIDTPPVLIAADTPILGTMVDMTMMVIRAGRTTVDAFEHARTALLNAGARLTGTVLNGVNPSGRYGRYYYYYYKYNYSYTHRTPSGELKK